MTIAVTGQGETTMDKIKPCPFCGGEASYCYHMELSWVQCSKCRTIGQRYADEREQRDGREKAIAAWNRRVNDE